MIQTIGFYGFGKLATALIASWNNTVKQQVSFYRRNEEEATRIEKEYNIRFLSSEKVTSSNLLFLAFKPQQLPDVANILKDTDFSNTILISLLAGTKTETLHNYFPTATRIVRMMPNTSVAFGEGVTGIFYTKTISDTEKEKIQTLMHPTGLTVEVEHESEIDTITGFSGSAPAFVYELAQGMLSIKDTYGLNQETRKKIIAQMLIGAGTTLLKSGKSPHTLISEIASAKGTTEAGLNECRKRNISTHFAECIVAAINRAIELGET